jgi:hypothetical protein
VGYSIQRCRTETLHSIRQERERKEPRCHAKCKNSIAINQSRSHSRNQLTLLFLRSHPQVSCFAWQTISIRLYGLKLPRIQTTQNNVNKFVELAVARKIWQERLREKQQCESRLFFIFIADIWYSDAKGIKTNSPAVLPSSVTILCRHVHLQALQHSH